MSPERESPAVVDLVREARRRAISDVASWLRQQGTAPALRAHPGIERGDLIPTPWKVFTDDLADEAERLADSGGGFPAAPDPQRLPPWPASVKPYIGNAEELALWIEQALGAQLAIDGEELRAFAGEVVELCRRHGWEAAASEPTASTAEEVDL